MTQWVRVPARCLHHLPDRLPFEQAGLTEPCCVAYNAVVMNASIKPGDRVVVLGPGPIGILCGAMARLQGAQVAVVGLERDRARLNVAEQYGCEAVVEGLDEWVRFGDGKLGVDGVIDAAGVSATLKTALENASGPLVAWISAKSDGPGTVPVITRSTRWCKRTSRCAAVSATTGRSGSRVTIPPVGNGPARRQQDHWWRLATGRLAYRIRGNAQRTDRESRAEAGGLTESRELGTGNGEELTRDKFINSRRSTTARGARDSRSLQERSCRAASDPGARSASVGAGHLRATQAVDSRERCANWPPTRSSRTSTCSN